MKKLAILVVCLCALGGAGYFVLTAPFTWELLHPTRDVATDAPAVLANGKTLFYAAACGTCHSSPNQADETRLGGGQELTSGFGNFYMPNISPDTKDGIGAWTTAEFVRALRQGVNAHGQNIYPALPYTSYQRMTANDLRDLFGYIKTLPDVAGKARSNDLKFPFDMRSGVGVWKLVFLDGEPLTVPPGMSANWQRGQYLVEGPGHCAECHSPRNLAGAIVSDKRFSGGPNPDGNGSVPNITPDDTGIGYWSRHEISDYLNTGVSPIGLQAGGSMVAIIDNMKHLSQADRDGMADYLKSLKPIDAPNAGVPEPNRTEVVRMLPPSAKPMASPASALALPASALASAPTLYTVAIKPVFLAKPTGAAAGDGDARLLPSAKLAVLARDGDFIQVRVDGWQQDGSAAALYALEGQRILVAALSPAAAAKVVKQKAVVDATTKQTWYPASLTVWTTTADLNPDAAKLWAYSATLYGSSCGSCHALHPVSEYLANQWIGNLATMKRFAGLDDGSYRLLLAYLQFHSKDVSADAAGGKL